MSHTALIYSHGKDGSAWSGPKIIAIRPKILELGVSLISIQYDESDNLSTMIEHCIARCCNPSDVPGKLILAGSSRGAYISVSASQAYFRKFGKEVEGLFLIAPAFNIKPEYYPDPFPTPKTKHLEIVHGFRDDLIPYENSVKYGLQHGGNVHLLHDIHPLNVHAEEISHLLQRFVKRVLPPS